MADGRVGDRDRLLSYTVGEYYQEMSLFIEESRIRKAEFEKIKNGTK